MSRGAKAAPAQRYVVLQRIRREAEKSEFLIVPMKPANVSRAEPVEGRGNRVKVLKEGQMAGTPSPQTISTQQLELAPRAKVARRVGDGMRLPSSSDNLA